VLDDLAAHYPAKVEGRFGKYDAGTSAGLRSADAAEQQRNCKRGKPALPPVS
jgi:hypothetical protein